jgi:hypothetical protein
MEERSMPDSKPSIFLRNPIDINFSVLPNYPHILLIAGTGRNSGKTNLACRILEKFRENLSIYALKISPHLHRETPSPDVLIHKPTYMLYEESDVNPEKDSARMLAAGAEKSYYMEVRDDHLNEAVQAFFELLPASVPLIVESPALIRHLTPGLFIVVDNPHTTNKKKEILDLANSADWFIKNGSEVPEAILDKLDCDASGWKLNVNP